MKYPSGGPRLGSRDGIWPFRDAEYLRLQDEACDRTRHLSLKEILMHDGCDNRGGACILCRNLQTISDETLEAMKIRQMPGTRWAVYQNLAMDSSSRGHLQFLRVGDGCTHKEPPRHYPDTENGLGWKYWFIGFVDLKTGEINEV